MVYLGELDMNHPYREPGVVVPLTVEVKTTDYYIEVAYLDRSGLFTKEECTFLGKPSAYIGSRDTEIQLDPNWGKYAFDAWKREIGTSQLVSIYDLLIPMYRVLDIRIQVKERVAVVDVKDTRVKDNGSA